MLEKSTKVKVEGLPQDVTVSQLTLLLSNKRRQGGGPIDSMELTKDTAIVTFETSDAVDIILGRGNIVQLNDVNVRVSRYFDPDSTKSIMKRCRSTSAKGKISTVGDEQESSLDDLSDCEDLPEKVKKKFLKDTSKKKATVGIKKQPSVPDEEAKMHRKMSKTYSQSSDDEHANSADEKSENESSRESKSKTQKSVKDNKANKSSMLPKTFPAAKESIEEKMKMSKHAESHDELSESESQSEKPKNSKHRSLKEISAKKKSSVGKKTTSDSDRDSKGYWKKSTTHSRTISDDKESFDESTESESSPEKPERKAHSAHKMSPKEKLSSVVKKIPDSENSEEEHIEEPEKPWKTTIKAKVSDITKTKDFYVMYFEVPHISQGQFYEESFLLDGLNKILYLTFCDRKAAVDTVRFKHKPESNLQKVEMATQDDFNTHSNLISVHGYYCSTAEQKKELRKNLEDITKMEVMSIVQQDEPRSAIIVFNPDSCEGPRERGGELIQYLIPYKEADDGVNLYYDISAVTWMRFNFGNVRLIVAPVFKTNWVNVTGLHNFTSDDTVQRYMSNTKRGGGDITSFQRLSNSEACINFKESKSVDGLIAKNPHSIDGSVLHVSSHYPCLSTEVYKMHVEPLQQQLMINTDGSTGRHSGPSRQVRPREGPETARPFKIQSRLTFKKVSIYTSIDLASSKKIQYVLKLCKFGFEFLERQEDELIKQMQLVHCQHTLVPVDNIGMMFLTLNYPHKINNTEVINMLENGLRKVREYLDTFTVAQFSVVEIYKLQQYYLLTHQYKLLDFDIFFDHLNNLACVIISKGNEHVIDDEMNKMYHKFMTIFLCPAASGQTRSHMNNSQSSESRQRQTKDGLQNTREGMENTFENLDSDGIEAAQRVRNSNDFNKTNKKKKPSVSLKLRKGKNKTKESVDNESIPVLLTVEQELDLGEKEIIMLEKTHFHKDLEKYIMPLQIILNTEKMCAIIKSNDKSKISNAELELYKKMRDFTNIDVTSLFSPEQLQYLNKQEVQNKINDIFLEMKYHAHLRCCNGTVNICHVKDVNTELLKDVAISQATARKKPLDKDIALILQSEKGRKFLAGICEINDGMKVSSHVKLEDNCLHIVSPAEQLGIVLKAIDRFVEENKSFEKSISFCSGKHKFVKKYLSQDLAQISNSLIPLGARIVEHADKYTVQGLKEGVMVGVKKLFQLSEQILVQEVNLKYFGIKEFLQTPEGESLLTRIENAQPCVILPTTALPSGQGNTTTFSSKQLQPQKPPSLIALAKVGDYSIMFHQGDITSLDTEAIVNPLDSTLKCNSGLAKALVLKGSNIIETELASSHARGIPGEIIQTSAGNLDKCKTIIHVVCPIFNITEIHKLESAAVACLRHASSRKLKSIAIPALGTGKILKFDTFVACQRLIKALHQHLISGDSTLKNIYLCDTKADHVKQLIDRFKNAFSQDVENVGSLQETSRNEESLHTVMISVSDHADLKIYADSRTKIARANKTLNDAVKSVFRVEKDTIEQLKKFSKQQVRQLEDEGGKNYVKVTVTIEESLITMCSFNKDGILNIHKLLKTHLLAAEKAHNKSLIEAVQSAVVWQFELQQWRNFEPILNCELESEYKKMSKHHDITDAIGRAYRVDFSAMKEFQLNIIGVPYGRGINVRRYDRTKEGEPLPKQWDQMKSNENLKLVTLVAGSPEFKAAKQRFIQGGSNMPIKKIERIQNKSLYQIFKAKKREMDHRNPKWHENEQRLFHGTDAGSVKAINETGFNRSYCGKNATAYGNGVYFAVQSSYSVNYARPSAQGERLVYIVRVLTGESTPSRSGMSYLPNKPGTNIPYDSGTAGGIFIIFHDTQTYPEYLITF